MQVMNNADFEQKEVLIGQQGKTESFGVSDDAALMSMLSTGLYKNPLRTMIQEIIFNAWDAHRMGGIQQTTPIDIVLNETSGLVVRDYGPGIHPDQMVPIYCIYGNSTKRDDSGSTGGFGLGSKSPFSYTESFNVSSYHKGKHNMYMISRASDDNDGKPGMTPIIQDIDTEETGLRVIVPIKPAKESRNRHHKTDLDMAKEYLLDILKLSGIWCNFTWKDNDPKEIKADKVGPNDFLFGDYNIDEKRSVFAVYGGVKYKLEKDPYYDQELEIVSKIATFVNKNLYIGFKPDSLTPLPSREGLNVSVKTAESIKETLELFQDRIYKMLEPMAKVALDYLASNLIGNTDLYRLHGDWLKMGLNHIMAWYGDEDIRRNQGRKLLSRCKREDVHMKVMEAALFADYPMIEKTMFQIMWEQTSTFAKLIDKDKFKHLLNMAFVRRFPEMRKVALKNYDLSKADVWEAEVKVVADYIAAETKKPADIRLQPNGYKSWHKLTYVRQLQKSQDNWKKFKYARDEPILRQIKAGTHTVPTAPSQSLYWSNGARVSETSGFNVLRKVAFLAPSVKMLNDFGDEHPLNEWVDKPFTYGPTNRYTYNIENRMRLNAVRAVGFIGNTPKTYELIKQKLLDEGWFVKEIMPPKREEGTTENKAPAQPKTEGWPVYHGRMYDGWTDIHKERVSNPKWYIYATLSEIKDTCNTSIVSHAGAHLAKKVYPNQVTMLNNKRLVTKALKEGIRPFHEEVDRYVDKLTHKAEDKIAILNMYDQVARRSGLPEEIFYIGEMQKMFHLQCVSRTRLKNYRQLKDELYAFQNTYDRECVSRDSYLKARTVYCQRVDLSIETEEICNKMRIFDSYRMSDRLQEMKPGEIKVFAEKLIRFMKTL